MVKSHQIYVRIIKPKGKVFSICTYVCVCQYKSDLLTGTPLIIKKSVRLKYESSSVEHPSLQVTHKDINNGIIYDDTGEKVKTTQRQFTVHKKDIFEQWKKEAKQLIQDIYISKGKKCIKYPGFARLCPSYILLCSSVLLFIHLRIGIVMLMSVYVQTRCVSICYVL